MKQLFGRLVRSRRVAARMTLETLAGRIKSVKGYVSGIENGKVSPPAPEFVAAIAGVLGLNVRKMQLLAWLAKAPAVVQDAPEYREICDRVTALED